MQINQCECRIRVGWVERMALSEKTSSFLLVLENSNLEKNPCMKMSTLDPAHRVPVRSFQNLNQRRVQHKPTVKAARLRTCGES